MSANLIIVTGLIYAYIAIEQAFKGNMGTRLHVHGILFCQLRRLLDCYQMTTIVGDWSNKVLVADSQFTDTVSGIKYFEEKVFPVEGGGSVLQVTIAMRRKWWTT
jgi:hypothetical protein